MHKTPTRRNAAFAASSGRFVLYLDGDDVISAEHVALLLAAIDGSELDVAVGEWDRFHVDIHESLFPARVTYQSLAGPDWCLLDWQYVNMTQCGMFLIPRALVVRCGGWHPDLSQGPIDDFEFFARILSNCRMVNFVPGARLYYRSGIYGSLSTKRRSLQAAGAQLRSLQMGIGHLRPYVNSLEQRRVCANLLKYFVYEHFPYHRDLRRIANKEVKKLGGSNIEPDGPPGFDMARRFIGWKLARILQLVVEKIRIITGLKLKKNWRIE
jgi:glycosyltransferase involved in cell wall biosynthesis